MRMRDDDGHSAMLEAGKAWRRIKTTQTRTWSDWTMIIGPGLVKARAEAMALAGTNQPLGRGYNSQMAELLKEYKLDDMGETTRAHLLKIMENPAAVEEWRARQKDPGDLNHPSRVWTKYQRSSKQQDARDKDKRGKKSKAQETATELAAALQRIEELDQELAGAKTATTPLDHMLALLRWLDDSSSFADLVETAVGKVDHVDLIDLSRKIKAVADALKKATAKAKTTV